MKSDFEFPSLCFLLIPTDLRFINIVRAQLSLLALLFELYTTDKPKFKDHLWLAKAHTYESMLASPVA